MSLASVFAITAMMLILGLFFVITVNVNLFTEMVKADYDEIEIFLEDSTGVEDAQSMMNQIETFDGVEKVEYRTKEDALNIMKKRVGREQLSPGFTGRESSAQFHFDHCFFAGERRKGYPAGQRV